MLQKIHNYFTYFLASIFVICFLVLLVLVTLFLVGVQSLEIIFIPFDILESFSYIYLFPVVILFVSIPLLIMKRKSYSIITTLSGLVFIAAAVIYYLYADAESATTQLVGLAGSAFAYSLAMMLIIIAAYVILSQPKQQPIQRHQKPLR